MNLVHHQSQKKLQKLLDRLAVEDLLPKRFAIYGIGAVAKLLTEALSGFHITGLMDKDPENIGKTIYGYEILSRQSVIESVDVIIIAASDVYWETIYKRIASLKKDHGKRILFTNGEEAQVKTEQICAEDRPYWKTRLDDLKREIDHHAVISFDVFDTLICRKISRADDLFSVVESRAKGIFPPGENFIRARKEAEEYCRNHGDPHCDIHRIYRTMGKLFRLSEKNVNRLKEMEIEAEMEFSAPRTDMIELFRYAVDGKRRVYLVSDFHLPAVLLRRILEKWGIWDYTGILVSCDQGKSKEAGELWRQFRSLTNNDAAFHIGDNDLADIANPAALGINTAKVMGCHEMLFSSSISDLAVQAKNIQDSKILGLLQHHLFNSPFALNGTKGTPEIRELSSFGYVFLGPLIYNYLAWLFSELRNNGYERILFLAREGYLLERLYTEIRTRLSLTGTPLAIYFKTSRRMASVASMKTMEDILDNLRDSFSGTVRELLLYRFGINRDKENSQEIIVNSDPGIREIIKKYSAEILKNAETERRNYLRYMEDIGLKPESRLAIADIGLKGSIQYHLGKIFDARFDGFYVTAFTGASNPYGIGNNVKALYPEEAAGDGQTSRVFNYHILFESALAAPEGMYIKANGDGSFTNGPLFSNQKLFEKKKEIHEGIRSFILDMLESDGTLPSPASPRLVDELFGLPAKGACIIADEIKKTFFVDDLYGVNNEKPIWES